MSYRSAGNAVMGFLILNTFAKLCHQMLPIAWLMGCMGPVWAFLQLYAMLDEAGEQATNAVALMGVADADESEDDPSHPQWTHLRKSKIATIVRTGAALHGPKPLGPLVPEPAELVL